ncbi:GrpB family protein [Paenibacillus dendritiformis]|uniref:GrpB family protein n=1 Tax=Paenibacillus dendritiformis TaxID=130049 RepID=UPI0034D979A9
MRNEFLFRDYLQQHPDLVREYSELKKRTAKINGVTMEQYTRSKTEFISREQSMPQERRRDFRFRTFGKRSNAAG